MHYLCYIVCFFAPVFVFVYLRLLALMFYVCVLYLHCVGFLFTFAVCCVYACVFVSFAFTFLFVFPIQFAFLSAHHSSES